MVKAPRLTKRLVEGAAPGPVVRFLWDAEVAGFGVRISPSGVRAYVVQYRFEGASRRLTIGRHGAPWTVQTARACARARLVEIARGTDPGPRAKRCAPPLTLEALCARYLAEAGPDLAASTLALDRGVLRNHVVPRLGPQLAAAVCAEDIERLTISVARGKTGAPGGPRAAEATTGFLSRVFVFGMRRGLCEDNPVFGTPRFRRTTRQHFLNRGDYERLGAALDLAEATGALNRSAVAAIRLILLSGLRPGEALALTACDVDFDAARLRIRGPGGRRRIAWLSPAAAEVLGVLPVRSEAAPLFPAPCGAPLGVKTLEQVWNRLRAAVGADGVRLTDLRYSFGAVAAGLGFSLKVVGRVMGDLDPSTPARYAEFATPEVKQAGERISAEIARLIGEAPVGLRPAGPHVDPRTRRLIEEVARRTWLTSREAAARAGLTVSYLWALRRHGLGPPCRKLASGVMYDEAELEAWVQARRRVVGKRGRTRGEGRRSA
jgi:integrase